MDTRLSLDKELLDNLQVSQSDNWHFCVKLMYLLRCGKINTTDKNMDIYKKVVGAIAEDRIKEQKKHEEEYNKFLTLWKQKS